MPTEIVPAYDVPDLDAIEIIPAAQVRPLIEATRRELQILERTAADAIAAADDAEEWARIETNDGSSSTWSLIRLHRENRDEAQRDAQVMIELATRHAQHLLADVQAQADEVLGAMLGAPVVPEPPAPVAVAAPPAPILTPVPEPVVEPEPVEAKPVARKPAAAKAVAPKSVARKTTARKTVARKPVGPAVVETAVAEVKVAEATVVAEPVVEPAAIEPALVEPTVVTPKAVAPTVVTPAVVVPEPVAFEAAPVPAPAVVADTAFWPVETSERRRYSLPISAVLEAAAVLMILIFILLRLS